MEVGDYRYANLLYRGNTPTMQIGDYLRKRMPQHSYQLISHKRTNDRTEQYIFERGAYTATCTVRGLARAKRTRRPPPDEPETLRRRD